MTAAPKVMTAEEFMELPEPADGGKMELVRGRVVCMSPVNPSHARVSRRIGARPDDFADAHGLGDVGVEGGFRLQSNPDTLLGPDVHFTSSMPSDDSRFVDGPPTLAVEVVSPSDRDTDVQAKVETYLHHGVERVWVVHPDQRSVTVYRGDGTARLLQEGDKLRSEDAAFAVEGFELAIAEIFAQ